jgi:O-antigen/teichoic acid export membrane protein
MDLFPAIPPEQRSWPRRVLNRLEVNRAVFYALALRGWQLVGGAVSMLLISLFFTEAVQGYYYTFTSLVAVQSFFELGLATVIVTVASHEWARLRLNDKGEPEGDPHSLSRLAGLARFVTAWYGLVCLLFVAAVGAAGIVYFTHYGSQTIAWTAPWVSLVVLSGVVLWMTPLVAILEGCEQVGVVNRFRLIQAVAANVAVWVALVGGVGLWALVAAAAARLVCDAVLLGVRYRPFFRGLLQTGAGSSLDWRREVWPMQWRLAISSVVGYFAFAFFTPVIFSYQGDAAAGRFGMTWTLVTVLHSAAIAWVHARAPLFGVLISRGDYAELERVYQRLFRVSLLLLIAACVFFWMLIAALDQFDVWLADRLLPPLPTALFLAAIVLHHIPCCQNFYLRAHRREIMVWQNVVSSLSIGLLVWLLGSRYGATGVAAAYLAVRAIITVPYQTYLYRRFREENARDRGEG